MPDDAREARLTRWVNVALGVVVAALGAWLLLLTRSDLAFKGSNNEPGPGYFPGLITACLIVLGLMLAGIWLFGPRARSGTAERLSLKAAQLRRAVFVWLILAVTAALIEQLGFLAAGELMVIALIVLVDRVRSIPLIITLLLLPFAMYGLFALLLDVQLPGGLLWT
jgi:hypothetical protein